MTKRVIERGQSIIGRIFFIFKVNTVEKTFSNKNIFLVRGTANKIQFCIIGVMQCKILIFKTFFVHANILTKTLSRLARSHIQSLQAILTT